MTKVFKVDDMSCDHCKSKIEGALKNSGEKDFTVDLENKLVSVNTETADNVLREVISDVGYTAIPHS